MNRTELIGEVAKHTGLTTKQAESGLKGFEFVVTSALRGSDTVRITGFGTFKVRDRAARAAEGERRGVGGDRDRVGGHRRDADAIPPAGVPLRDAERADLSARQRCRSGAAGGVI